MHTLRRRLEEARRDMVQTEQACAARVKRAADKARRDALYEVVRKLDAMRRAPTTEDAGMLYLALVRELEPEETA